MLLCSQFIHLIFGIESYSQTQHTNWGCLHLFLTHYTENGAAIETPPTPATAGLSPIK